MFTYDFGYTMLGVKPMSMNYGPGYRLRRMKQEEKDEAKAFLKDTFSFSGRFLLYQVSGTHILIDRLAVAELYAKNGIVRKYIKEIYWMLSAMV